MVAAFVIFVGSALVLHISTYLRLRNTKKKFSKKLTIIGFFHPNCDGGAGGEKVLWSAVQALQMQKMKNDEKLQILIYSASKMPVSEILDQKVLKRFGIKINVKDLHFINLD
jgi:alpha-1,2-mannosyltransferase